MRHQVKKIKFAKGKDATEAIIHKLIVNFIIYGKVKTTLTKAKILKGLIDRLVSKAKEKNKSARNILMKYLRNEKIINRLLNVVIPKFDDRKSGFVRIVRLGKRLGDGAEIGKVEWVKPIIEIQNSIQSPNKSGSGKELKIKNEKQKSKTEKEKKYGKSNSINQISKK
jgi:large subunit ribosomal protein L17